jgi:hypothetical protein
MTISSLGRNSLVFGRGFLRLLRFDALVNPCEQQIGKIEVVAVLHQHVAVAF